MKGRALRVWRQAVCRARETQRVPGREGSGGATHPGEVEECRRHIITHTAGGRSGEEAPPPTNRAVPAPLEMR